MALQGEMDVSGSGCPVALALPFYSSVFSVSAMLAVTAASLVFQGLEIPE